MDEYRINYSNLIGQHVQHVIMSGVSNNGIHSANGIATIFSMEWVSSHESMGRNSDIYKGDGPKSDGMTSYKICFLKM